MSGTTSTLQPINAIAQFVNGTQATWNAISVPIPAGLIVYATDTTVVKLGDGITLYANLPTAFTINDILTLTSNVTALSANLAGINTTLAALQADYTAISATVATTQTTLAGITYTSSVSTSGNVIVTSDEYFIGIANTTPAAITVTLPASPVTDERHVIKDMNGAAQSYNITVQGNGKTIDGASVYVINTNYESLELFYANGAWSIV